jgi:hypothetical protein
MMPPRAAIHTHVTSNIRISFSSASAYLGAVYELLHRCLAMLHCERGRAVDLQQPGVHGIIHQVVQAQQLHQDIEKKQMQHCGKILYISSIAGLSSTT